MEIKKIAYIELDTHPEIASNFYETSVNKGVEVDFYFSQKIFDQLDSMPNSKIFLATPQNILGKLKGKNYDEIIIGTVHRYFNIFEKITKTFPTLVIAHNLNFVRSSKLNLLKSIFKKETIYRLKLLLREGLLKKDKVYQNAKQILVLSEALVKHNPDLKLSYFSIFSPQKYTKETNEIPCIVIPGNVSQHRRDYQHVINKIKNIPRDQNYTFCFLGKASGKEFSWLMELEDEIPQQIKLVYFTEKVDRKGFDYWMKKADVLWCPIQPKTEFFSIPEFYGITKISGNIGDVDKYQKPAIFPQNYAGESSFIHEEKPDFLNQIQELTTEQNESNF